MKKTRCWTLIISALLLSLFVFFPACSRLDKLEKSLKPEEASWLSEVRYIITPEERKIFLEMPESERAQFIEDFWKRRDPFPDTDKNEYKDDKEKVLFIYYDILCQYVYIFLNTKVIISDII
mgnify:CR=1 FL=1